jgi:hypothetical protein
LVRRQFRILHASARYCNGRSSGNSGYHFRLPCHLAQTGIWEVRSRPNCTHSPPHRRFCNCRSIEGTGYHFDSPCPLAQTVISEAWNRPGCIHSSPDTIQHSNVPYTVVRLDHSCNPQRYSALLLEELNILVSFHRPSCVPGWAAQGARLLRRRVIKDLFVVEDRPATRRASRCV